MGPFKITGALFSQYISEEVILWPPEAVHNEEYLTSDLPMTGIMIDVFGVCCMNDNRQGECLVPIYFHPVRRMEYEIHTQVFRENSHPDIRGLLIGCADEMNRCTDGINPGELMLAIQEELYSKGWVRMWYLEEGERFWSTVEPEQLIGD